MKYFTILFQYLKELIKKKKKEAIDFLHRKIKDKMD